MATEDQRREPSETAGTVTLVARLEGRVQGVGMRWWIRSRALELGLAGSATNLPDGRVEVIAVGPREACAQLLHLVSVQPAPPVPADAPRSYYRRPGSVSAVSSRWEAAPEPPPKGFVER